MENGTGLVLGPALPLGTSIKRMSKSTPRRKLSDLVEVKPGYAFRSKIEHDPGGDFVVIQPSNVGPAGEVDVAELPRVGEVKPQSYHLVDADTVLFVAYGPRNRAYRFEDLPDNTIASSTFYLLKPLAWRQLNLLENRNDRILPGYLAWYLNQPQAQFYIEELRSGVSVQMLRRDALGSLEIPVPPVDMQKKVAKIALLAVEEEQLTRALMEKRRTFIDNLLLDKIQNS